MTIYDIIIGNINGWMTYTPEVRPDPIGLDDGKKPTPRQLDVDFLLSGPESDNIC